MSKVVLRQCFCFPLFAFDLLHKKYIYFTPITFFFLPFVVSTDVGTNSIFPEKKNYLSNEEDTSTVMEA